MIEFKHDKHPSSSNLEVKVEIILTTLIIIMSYKQGIKSLGLNSLIFFRKKVFSNVWPPHKSLYKSKFAELLSASLCTNFWIDVQNYQGVLHFFLFNLSYTFFAPCTNFNSYYFFISRTNFLTHQITAEKCFLYIICVSRTTKISRTFGRILA